MSGWVLKRVNKRLSDVPRVPWDWTERKNPAFEDAKECVHRRVTNEGRFGQPGLSSVVSSRTYVRVLSL